MATGSEIRAQDRSRFVRMTSKLAAFRPDAARHDASNVWSGGFRQAPRGPLSVAAAGLLTAACGHAERALAGGLDPFHWVYSVLTLAAPSAATRRLRQADQMADRGK
jgi:hypothetical protein